MDSPERDDEAVFPLRVAAPFQKPRDQHTRDQSRTAPDGDIETRLREVFHSHRANLVRFLAIRLGSDADAQDAAQDAVFRLLQRRQVLQDQDLRALLYVTARNIAIDRLRERGRSPINSNVDIADEAVQLADESASPERIIAARQRLALIRTLLQELPPKCQHAFVSYKFDGLEYGEIAVRMGLTESMVRKYVLRALAHCTLRFDELEQLQ
jgi:RNA polymerase sigma factor (sigma-70 family)